MIGALSQIADAVQQYRNAPFRSADWLANEVIAILESPGFAAHPTPPSADGAGVGDGGEVEDDKPAAWAIAAETAAANEYAAHMGDPDGRDDYHAARTAAARVIQQHAIAALRPSSDQPGGERDHVVVPVKASNEIINALVPYVAGETFEDADYEAEQAWNAVVAALLPGLGER